MKKKLSTLAVAAIALASCTSDDLGSNTSLSPTSPSDSIAVGFEVYAPRAVSRGGYVGIIGNTQLQQTKTDGGGFGVFGYYTDNNDYDPQSQPNFMYNQYVGYNNDGRWEYDPIKYWPNEYGSDATSDDADRVSFFAYAPFVEVVPSTGKLIKQNGATSDEDKWGITGMTRNSATGDPIVKYIASFDQDKSVDLLWGTVGASKTQWDIVQGGATQELDEGLPWLNIQRPREAATQAEASQRVTFQFEHALSQLSINIDADVDEAGHTHVNDLSSKTRIWVRNITFNGFAIKGALNLNNTEAGPKKAYWLDYNGTADLINGEAITVHDGLKDGKEGTDGAFASNEKTLGLTPQIIQSNADIDYAQTDTAAWKADKKGVTKDAVSVFRKWDETNRKYVASDAPIMVIPTGDDFDIEIVYDVETIDPNLAGYVSDGKTLGNSFECRIRKTVTFGTEAVLENGKHYTLNLHLGMNSVKLDAAVTDWQDAPQAEGDLPLNVPAYAAQAKGSAPEPNRIDLTATTTKYEFAITGLYGGETMTVSTATGNISDPTTQAANANGVALQSVTIAPNTKIIDQDAVGMRWTGASSGRFASFHFVQKAHVIGLGANDLAAGTTITLTSTAAGIDWSLITLAIKKNGVDLEEGVDFTVANNVVILTTAAVVNDTYAITANGGDAPEETITVKCK